MSQSQHSHRLATYSYGKDDVRFLRVVRDESDPRHHRIVEYAVRCLLSGSQLETSYTQADNSKVVATDSIKNTINLLAKKTPGPQVLCPESFALVIMNHFLSTYSHIDHVDVDIEQSKWSRIVVGDVIAASSGRLAAAPADEASSNGKQHPHSFVKDGNEKRTVKARSSRDDAGRATVALLEGGLEDLVVLKTSGSAFYGFWRDEYTTLPEVTDRCFSTSVNCKYEYKLPSQTLDVLASEKGVSMLPPFDDVARAAMSHILETFCTHESPSVQNTLYQTGGKILDDTSATAVSRVELQMPNRHYIPIDLSWAKIENLKSDNAEVFLPSAHPSGLIKACVARS